MGTEILYEARNISLFRGTDRPKLRLSDFFATFAALLAIYAIIRYLVYGTLYHILILHEREKLKIIGGVWFLTVSIIIVPLFIQVILSINTPLYYKIRLESDKLIMEMRSFRHFLIPVRILKEYQASKIKKLFTNENNDYIAMYFIYEDEENGELQLEAIYKDDVPRFPEFLRALKKVVKNVDSESKISRREVMKMIGKEPPPDIIESIILKLSRIMKGKDEGDPVEKETSQRNYRKIKW